MQWTLTVDFREIFGPVLPIVPVESVDEAYNIVRNWYAPVHLSLSRYHNSSDVQPFFTFGHVSVHEPTRAKGEM